LRDIQSVTTLDRAAPVSRDGLAGPATVGRRKRRDHSRAFADYGPNEGLLSVFAGGPRRREPSLTGDKAPRRLSRDCRVAVISA
jgi:hypothetical protein